MFCRSEICFAALKNVLLHQNIYCHSEICYPDGMHTLCSCHMAPAKPTVCHRVVNFVRTVEHGEGTRRGVERSVNTFVARQRPARPGESFGHTQSFSPGGYKR